jgi:hypothetical protein
MRHRAQSGPRADDWVGEEPTQSLLTASAWAEDEAATTAESLAMEGEVAT